jgi:hypothetical protein
VAPASHSVPSRIQNLHDAGRVDLDELELLLIHDTLEWFDEKRDCPKNHGGNWAKMGFEIRHVFRLRGLAGGATGARDGSSVGEIDDDGAGMVTG